MDKVQSPQWGRGELSVSQLMEGLFRSLITQREEALPKSGDNEDAPENLWPQENNKQ